MKILYPNVDIFDIRCDGRDNTKEKWSLQKQNSWVKKVKTT